jgi:tetratricopeptide (TPR) repeat protein
MAMLRSGRLDEAVAAYDSAIAKSKKAPAASYMGRALAYARKGDLKKAEADAAEARKTDPAIDEEFERYGLRLKDMLATK